MNVDVDRRVALERKDAARKALDAALAEIDGLAGNEIYRKAWKKAAMRIEALKDRESF